MAFTIIAVFRGHPHISNVLAPVAGGDWRKAERAIATILDPAADGRVLPPLERNLVRLLRAERGTTGRLLKPYFEQLAERALGVDQAKQLFAHLDRLLVELDDRR